MLRNRELIPPLTLHVSHNRTVRAWDFKQKRNLIIVLLDANCSLCQKFALTLATHTEALDEREVVTVLVFPESASLPVRVALPARIIAGTDVHGQAARSFLGQDARSEQAFERRGIFVTDRYGELSEQWVIEGHAFPGILRILSTPDQIQMACEECGAAHWLDDE